MQWSELYPMDRKPEKEDIGQYIDSPLWQELGRFIESSYYSTPSVEYSRCSEARGWNVKYKKGSRAICTLYPKEGYFTCMISIGRKEAERAEILLLSCTPYLKELYKRTTVFNGGRWLMIDVTSPEILDDTKELIRIRVGR